MVSPRARIAEAALKECELVTFERPDTCPWWSFHDADVQEVLRAYAYWEVGLQNYWGENPPYWLIDAVAFYHRSLERVRHDEWERQRAKQASHSQGSSDPDRTVIRG